MLLRYTFLLLSLFVFLSKDSNAQVVNAYAQITGITGTTLTVAGVNQTAHNFVVGEYVVIMQMQDDVLGNNSNTAAFGDLGTIQSAGLYEIRQITAIDGNTTAGFFSGAPTSVTVNSLVNTYNTGANSRVQLISFRRMSSGNFTTSSNISALAWNGTIGGVVAIEVGGTLTLNHSISANAAGFRGGARSINHNGSVCIAGNATRFRENNNQIGFKGEGIFLSTDPIHNNGRAKILNGGGGGSHHNAGGAGGGNYTQGGIGGNGYNNCTTNPAGGLWWHFPFGSHFFEPRFYGRWWWWWPAK